MIPQNGRCISEPILLCLRILLLILWLFAQTGYGQSWEQLTDFPGIERDDGVAFVLDNKAYCGTGLAPWWSPFGDFYAFDLDSETWSTNTPLPAGEERQYATGFSDGEFGYVFGGLNGEFLNDLWRYNPDNDEWTALPEPPASPRGGCTHFIVGDTAYIIGGKDAENAALAEVWAYDMSTATWTPKNDLPFGARWRASATAHNGKGYLVFGWDESADYRPELYQYEPQTDEWTLISSFPGNGRTHAALQSTSDALWLFGGKDSASNAYGDLWRFEPDSFEWTQLASIPAAGRRGGMVFLHSDEFYYTTGIDSDNNRLKETWKYQLSTGLDHKTIRESVILFPNPASESVELLLENLPQPLSTHCTASDVTGRVFWSGSIHSNNLALDISQWPKGVYFIRLQTEYGIITKNLLVE